nr:cell wall-binding repeat-containing protein [Lentibacillus saliphilus]
MIFSLVAPSMTFAATSDGQVSRSMHETGASAKEKMSKRLNEVFADEEKATFLVKFKEKADTKKAAEQGRSKAQSANLSAYRTELMQRSAVVSALKSTAIESQQNVKDYVEQEIANGNAENVTPYYIVNGMAVTATKAVAEKIAQFAEVEKILPNEKRELIVGTSTPNQDKPQSDVNNEVEWNVERVNAPQVWNMGIDGSGTVVASIDTGVDLEHPALKEKYRGYNAGSGDVDHDYNWFDATAGLSEPYDDQGHGTHVTGTMVGGEPNGDNQVGVAPGAQWIAVKAFTQDGGTDTDLLAAAQWILAPTDSEGNEDVSKSPDVVNNSWGGGPGLDEWYRDVVIAWRDANIFPEFSAGNTTIFNPGGPGSIATPANYPESFATGATDINDNLAGFSLRGPSPYDEIKPDISAPGVAIRSSVPGGGYALNSGTSMAGPAVSAVAALLRQVDPGMSVDDMEELLMNTAIPMTDDEYPESPNNGFGSGLVNAFDAVSSIMDGLGTIEGVVTQDGEDTEAPQFEHDPVDETYTGFDLPLEIHVSDNISVTSVQLTYENDTEQKTVQAEQISGDFRSGTFKATIPGDDVTGTELTYYWTVNDYGENEVTSDEYTVSVSDGISHGYFTDFETAPAGWYSFGDGDTWERGTPTSGPGDAFSGENVYATNLAGNYESNMDATLVMPPVTLPDGESYLQFKHWHDFEKYASGSAYDFAHVVVSTDGESWTQVETFDGLTDDWQSAEIDLSAYSGQTIMVGFQATSDGSVSEQGWYIDDVALSGTSNTGGQSGAETLDESTSNDLTASPTTLPMEAHISVVESGRSATTDPATGAYSLRHAVGDYTVKAEAYGFESEEQTVTVAEEATVTANFNLQELPQGTISGAVTNEKTGNAIEGATVLLVEDANVMPVETDAAGNYELTAYEGTYTLKVMAKDFYSKEISVTVDGDIEQDIALEPFYTVPGGEIGYDDGTIENARAFYDAGNAWAVKMSLPEGKDTAIVTDGVFQFYNEEWPTPGGTEFSVEVWSADEEGLPGEKLAGPIDAEAIRDLEEWTVVDLREENIIVDGDFFMVYVQAVNNPNAPGLATDEDGPFAGRSYQGVSGAWEQTPEDEGNYMIRARVAYEVEAPTIDSPEEGALTNNTSITVEGQASSGTTVKLMNNGEESGTQDVGDDGLYAIDVDLTEGENDLKAISVVNGDDAKESEIRTVILDTVSPELSIDSPEDGAITNRDTATIEGIVADAHLDHVTVNGHEADIAEDGSYAKQIILESGDNLVEVVAVDGAGNETTESITVTMNQTIPVIENLQPATDQYVFPGDQVEISFESSTEGGHASFAVEVPNLSGTHETNMEEVEPGVYVGTWTVPTNMMLEGAVVKVELEDAAGNKAMAEAEGQLYVYPENMERLSGETRYDTAIEVSKKGWTHSDTVVIARGDDYADALAGAPLAHKLNAPILLTKTSGLNEAVQEELERLNAEHVIVLGGEVAISSQVVNELKDMALTVERIRGESRYGTARLIAMEVAPDGANGVAVASGVEFPDALSIASHAAREGMPILLTRPDSLPEATATALSELGVEQTIVVGGTMAISDDVMSHLPEPNRLSGANRYETNVAINNHFDLSTKHMYVATGKEYADALTGTVLAAQSNSTVLLVGNDVPDVTANYITENNLKKLTILGGEIAVDADIVNALQPLLQ